MKTNRVITREEAASLGLTARIRLEMEVTDAEAAKKAQKFELTSGSTFDDYRTRSPWRTYLFDFLGPLAGRTILDLGCGYHPTSIYFALAGARRVYAVDVSPKAVAHIIQMAEVVGVADRITGVVCAAEQLPLPSESVDIIHGEAVLHHLQVGLAGPELARVLKNNGKAAFKDPLGHNPFLEFARDYFPYRFKAEAKGTDNPLRLEHIAEFGKNFDICTHQGFGFFSMLPVFISGKRDSKPYQTTHRLDAFLLSRFPRLQRYCRFVVVCATKSESDRAERPAIDAITSGTTGTLSDVLVCPACRGALRTAKHESIGCVNCQRLYPVCNEVPILLLGEASAQGGKRRAG